MSLSNFNDSQLIGILGQIIDRFKGFGPPWPVLSSWFKGPDPLSSFLKETWPLVVRFTVSKLAPYWLCLRIYSCIIRFKGPVPS